MERQEIERLVGVAVNAAFQAGEAANEIYKGQDVEVETKEDQSPLTNADKKSHDIICRHLSATVYPTLSEEGKDISFDRRKQWEYFWLVDPLDGTKEFIKRNGEFTVNIALIHGNEPVLGVVFAPYVGDLYFGAVGSGAYKMEGVNAEALRFRGFSELKEGAVPLPREEERDKPIIVASRSHMNDETRDFIDRLTKTHGDAELISKGSSLKICMVAEGKADVYPRFGPTMEWDTAAGHGLVLSAGLQVTESDGRSPLLYNKEDLHNPWFIVKGSNFRL